MRVPAEKIDHLVDAFGEFMQYRRRMVHSLAQQSSLTPAMSEMLSGGAGMLDDLRDTAVGLRTLPISAITGPLPHAVRDIAHAAGKEVDFVVTGAGTEIDRVILESLSEPLTHLLRNAVGHGIESPAEREQAGKARCGRVELRAVPRGSMVEIVVADDGRGVSPEVIEKARHEGSLVDLLTRAGYSTAGEVTELAGRGVGLDAVRNYVISVRGSLEIRSEPGRGMDVVLLLPVALALVEALLFERAGAAYGVPMASVEEVVMVGQTLMLQRQPALEVHGRSLPVVDVAEIIGTQAPPLPARSPGVVISTGGQRVITTCDVLLGTEEVMIKPLGLARAAGYLGASILGDGRIALLIEPTVLTRRSPRASGTAAPGAAAGPAAAPKVLVVEDSFTVRELQRSILEAAGYAVATARDGRDALNVLDHDPRIGLVITDLEMPELDGIELTRAIRGRPRALVAAGRHRHLAWSRGGPAQGDRGGRRRVHGQAQLRSASPARMRRSTAGAVTGGGAAGADVRGLPRLCRRAAADARVRRRYRGLRGLRHRRGGHRRLAPGQAGPGDHGCRAAGHERARGGRRDHERPAAADPGAVQLRRPRQRQGRGRARRRSTRRRRQGRTGPARPGRAAREPRSGAGSGCSASHG